MKFRDILAIAACKTSKKLLRMMKRGGTALPGKIAMKLSPELLGTLAKDVRCIIITGTNGKTTSARMVEEILLRAGLPCFSNRSGANLTAGITAEFISNCTLTGRPKKAFAVIEADEGACGEVCRLTDPQVVLVTNVFRDQLDRYGDVEHTLNSIVAGVKNSPNATICLNADCSLSVSIGDSAPGRTVFFGVNTPIYQKAVEEVSDAPHCLRCGEEYEYQWRTFGHLGGFFCPHCGYKRSEPSVAVTEILSADADSTRVKADIFGSSEVMTVNLPGGYNIYNAAGAVAAAGAMDISISSALDAVASFHCGFGRMELFDMGGVSARMILVKNPAGCNQVINYLSTLTEKTLFVCCLNDKTGDGKDISWIWDANFEGLTELGDRLSGVLVAGLRRDDMALRLKYAGISEDKLMLAESWDRLVEIISHQDLPVVIMPNYTAMMELRQKMSAAFGGVGFWE